MSSPRYANETAPRRRASLAAGAQRQRPHNRKIENAQQEKRRDAMRQNRVIVRGRYSRYGELFWDVLKIEGDNVSLYASGCRWKGEAMELGRACLTGRTVSGPSVDSVRHALVRSASGLLIPDRSIAKRGVKVRATGRLEYEVLG